jgi:hypothetical protein
VSTLISAVQVVLIWGAVRLLRSRGGGAISLVGDRAVSSETVVEPALQGGRA